MSARAMYILLVDDDADLLQASAHTLQQAGFATVTAGSGAAALASMHTRRPDLVLLDWDMPELDGLAVCRRIKATPDFADTLVVIFSGVLTSPTWQVMALESGADGHITRPIRNHELIQRVRAFERIWRLNQKLRDNASELQTLSRRVIEAQETERRRLAIELHDEFGQTLAAIKFNLLAQAQINPACAQCNAVNIPIIDQALQEVHALALALRPSMLDDLGLVAALRWSAEQAEQRGDLVVRFDSLLPELRLAPEIEIVCFRIVQEALTNIQRHAGAQQVTIELRAEDATLVLSVADDGCGFDPAAMFARAAAGNSLGLLGMRERATLIGGTLEIESAAGRECCVRLRCPLRLCEPA